MLDPITGPLVIEDIETTNTTDLVKWVVLLQNAITTRTLASLSPRTVAYIADKWKTGWRVGVCVVADIEGRAFIDLIGTTAGNTHIEAFADLVDLEPIETAH